MKIAWSVGESSGDVIGAGLIRALPNVVKHIGVGGPQMREAGIDAFEMQERLSVVGLLDVIYEIPFFVKLKKCWIKYLQEHQPDLLVLIDFPGFNRKLKSIAQKLGIPVLVIAPPQIWVWKESRVRNYLDVDVVCLFPFEKQLWDKYGSRAYYFGHPSFDRSKILFNQAQTMEQSLDLLLCPGSRVKSAFRNLDIYLELLRQVEFDQGGGRNLPNKEKMRVGVLFANQFIAKEVRRKFPKVEGLQAYFLEDGYPNANWAWTGVGTNTLELAIRQIPQVVIHKVDFITFWVARFLMKRKLFALPNILCQRKVVEEIIFNQIEKKDLSQRVFSEYSNRTKQIEDLSELEIEPSGTDFFQKCAKWILRTYHG